VSLERAGCREGGIIWEWVRATRGRTQGGIKSDTVDTGVGRSNLGVGTNALVMTNMVDTSRAAGIFQDDFFFGSPGGRGRYMRAMIGGTVVVVVLVLIDQIFFCGKQ
jgi:hypothetical protein